MKAHRQPGRRPKARTAPPHVHRLRHERTQRVNADALAQVRRARLTWDDVEPADRREARR